MTTLSLPKRNPIILRDFAVAFARAQGLPHSYRFYAYNDRLGCPEDLFLALTLTRLEADLRLAPESTVADAICAFKLACSPTAASKDWTVYLEGQDSDGRPGTIKGSCTVLTLHLRVKLAELIGEYGLPALQDAVAALRFVPTPGDEAGDSAEQPLEPFVEEESDEEDERAYFPGKL